METVQYVYSNWDYNYSYWYGNTVRVRSITPSNGYFIINDQFSVGYDELLSKELIEE